MVIISTFREVLIIFLVISELRIISFGVAFSRRIKVSRDFVIRVVLSFVIEFSNKVRFFFFFVSSFFRIF